MAKQNKTQIVQAVEQVTHADEQEVLDAFFDSMGLGQPQFTWRRTLCAVLVGVLAGSGVATVGFMLTTVATAAVLPISVWLAYFINIFGWSLTLIATFYASSRVAQWWLTGRTADAIEDKARAAKDKVLSLFKRSERPATVH